MITVPGISLFLSLPAPDAWPKNGRRCVLSRGYTQVFLFSFVPFSLGDFATKYFSSLKGDLKERKTALLVTTPRGPFIPYSLQSLEKGAWGGLKPSE